MVQTHFETVELLSSYIDNDASWNLLENASFSNNITNMNELFKDTSFNVNIASWDMTYVTSTESMFQNASSFNQPIGDWNMMSITSTSGMFKDATGFSQNLHNWDLQNLTDATEMFYGATSFVQDLRLTWGSLEGVIVTDISVGSGMRLNDKDLCGWWDSSRVYTPDASFNDAIDFYFGGTQGFASDTDENSIEQVIGIFGSSTQYKITHWDTSSVTSMKNTFDGRTDFNEDISKWDVSNVSSMSGMFRSSSLFNKPIGSWNTNNVVNAEGMFNAASAFNQDISGWFDSGNLQKAGYMFNHASSFNQDISYWEMSNVKSTRFMFHGASSFVGKDINYWDMSSNTNTASMFKLANSFSEPLDKWKLQNVRIASSMFSYTSYNQDISGMFPSNSVIFNISEMFKDSSFNQNISTWYTNNVVTTSEMFYNNATFNQNIDTWNTTSLINTSRMFYNASSFNQNLSNWANGTSNLNKLSNATEMFFNASAFNQDFSDAWGSLPNVSKSDISGGDQGSESQLKLGASSFLERILRDEEVKILDEIISSFTTRRASITNSYASTATYNNTSEGIPFMTGPRYGFLSINDYQKQTNSSIIISYNSSIMDDNVIARIHLAPYMSNVLIARDYSFIGLSNRTREYDSPVDIQKITVKLYDEYGRIIDLNNMDWSFTLEVEKQTSSRKIS